MQQSSLSIPAFCGPTALRRIDLGNSRGFLVTPGVGFGDKRLPTKDELELLRKLFEAR
jgi:orotidine-5'-phosphate decarboxylase